MIRNLMIAGIIAATSSIDVAAEVYQRLPGHAPASSRSASTAYTGEMEINGGRATVSVLSFQATLQAVMQGLRLDFPNPQGALYMSGQRMATVVIQHNNRVYRYLAITPTSPGHTLLFRVEQSLGDYNKSRHNPTRSLLTEVPSPPGAKPTFHMKDKKTSLSLEVSSSTMYPADIHQHLSDQFNADGWTPLIPIERMRNTPGLMIYFRGKELSMVSASMDPATRQSTITMLHKRPALR